MKKTLLLLLLTTFLLSGCGDKDTTEDTTENTNALTFQMSLPKDFAELEIEGLEFYYAAKDGSSVSLNLQPKDASFSQVTAGQLNAALSEAFLSAYETEVAITDNYFTINPISGYPAYQYSISYQLADKTVTQVIIGIDADQTYTFTYTDLTGDWKDIFEGSIKSITFLDE